MACPAARTQRSAVALTTTSRRGKGSPAIDASNAYLQKATDMLGDPRHDDPATANSGFGQPVYIASSAAAASLPTGTAISGGSNYAGSVVSYTLPFSFTFYGVAYNTMYVSRRRDLLLLPTRRAPWLPARPRSPRCRARR